MARDLSQFAYGPLPAHMSRAGRVAWMAASDTIVDFGLFVALLCLPSIGSSPAQYARYAFKVHDRMVARIDAALLG